MKNNSQITTNNNNASLKTFTQSQHYKQLQPCLKIAVNSYTQLTDNVENSMGGFVSQAGPLSICLDASNFNSYTGGVMWSCGQAVNHCVQAVGVEVDGYWKVRNQWGTGWGEKWD